MKKYLLILFIAVAGLSSCSKDDSDFDVAAQSAKDDAAIQAYLKANNVTDYVHDPSGLYYKIVKPGTGAYPIATSTVTVNYVGKLLNGTQFDAHDAFPASLGTGVIQGWTVGLQHINTGGSIILFVPSAMGYGNNDNGAIPKNSVLIFAIDVLSIK